MKETEKAWLEYQKEYDKTKNEMLSKLETIINDPYHLNKVYKNWLEQVAEFIKEQKG